MNRMLIATALRNDFAALTDDGVVAEYRVTTIW